MTEMDPMDKLSVLKKYFGHSSFRQGQEKLIDAILSGEDALGIMPTGGGKIRRVLELGLNTLSTYGLLKELPAEQVRAYIDRLEDEGYLRTNPDHLSLEPASSVSSVLFGGQKISLSMRVEDKPKGAAKGKKKRRKRKKQSCGFGACARGEHRPVFRPQGCADADRAGGERAGLSRLYQRSPYGYGRQKTPYHGGISGGLRRRREKSGTVWSGIPEGHRRL